MHVLVLLFLHYVRLKKFIFFVSLYKELLEPTFSVLDNLCEVFRFSVITNFVFFFLINDR